jgi:predicted AAA+ superfamily ATPase
MDCHSLKLTKFYFTVILFNMKISRFYSDLSKFLKPKKALVIFGPRQAGKTTLITDYLATSDLKYKLESGDNIKTQEIFSSQNFDVLKSYIEGYELLVIDEAQKIPNIGNGLKIIIDHVPKIKIIATGSSSFELAGQIGEPLTGRKRTLTLYPIAQQELLSLYNSHELQEKLPDYLIYGSYPEVITTRSKKEKINLLEELIHSYLLKDILELEKVKSAKLLLDLLRLLAYQIGSEVSLNELGQQLGIDTKTVARYLDLFEKAFVVYNLRGFSKNLRKEITKKSKYYFYDNGIRNAIISNFNDLEKRNDIGQLWENFIFMERIKIRSYHSINANEYFWRTWSGQEIDLIEERAGKLFAYEFKWSNEKVKVPKVWLENYPNSTFSVISKQNYLKFIT